MLICTGPLACVHADYVLFLGMREKALKGMTRLLTPAEDKAVEWTLEHVPPRIELFESKYAEWLANGAEAVWGFSDGPLPGLPEMP